MRYRATFAALALTSAAASLAARDALGWAASAIALYCALSLAALSAAYAGAGPRLLFKRPSGRRAPLGWLLLAPYLLLTAATFSLYRLLSREPAFARVAPGLYFGRRLSAGESRAAGWVGVLDLAGELAAAWVPPRYRSLPVLDATAPSETELRSAVAWVRQSLAAGPVYVHCALGHGRSACVVVGYLLSIGSVSTVAEGVGLVRSLRPGVRLCPAQLRLLCRFEPGAGTPDA